MFNTTIVYADEHGGSSGSFDSTPTPYPTLTPLVDPGEFFLRMVLPDGGEAIDYVSDWLENRWSNEDTKNSDYTIEDNGSTVHFHDSFINDFNNATQNEVWRLDGYYLIEPTNYYSPDRLVLQSGFTGDTLAEYRTIFKNTPTYLYRSSWISYSSNVICEVETDKYYYIDSGNSSKISVYDKSTNDFSTKPKVTYYSTSSHKFVYGTGSSFGNGLTGYDIAKGTFASYSYGSPYKIFYSKQDLINYILKGEKRTNYAPKLPSGGFKVPTKYITNVTNLPDINYGDIIVSGKAEANIQAELDAALKLALDKLAEIDVNPSVPTPTPIISDGQPTPTPGFTDGSLTPTPPPTNVDLTDTNNWLEKIYNWLEEFGKSHDKFIQDLSDYLETHKGKLEDIIKALDKIADGMEKGEDDGCKYDYSELSDFMKELWNESDKKFDTMIDLLEENNEYQKKLVDTLDSIKSILKTQSIMDTFKNRSKETAEKAKEKFPTSVPWDIAVIINAMSAEPKAPVFECPIEIKSLNIKEHIIVDLSTGEWETLAKTCRYMLSLLFVLFMVQLSRRLFFNKGDDD